MVAGNAPSYTPGTVPLDIVPAGLDDAHYYSGTFRNDQNFVWMGKHTTPSTGPWTAWRFQLPSGLYAPAITDARLKITAANTGGWDVNLRVKQANQSSAWDSSTNRPDTIYSAVGSTGQVRWTQSSVTIGSQYTSGNLASRVASAITNGGLSAGDYIAVLAGPYDNSAILVNQTVGSRHTHVVWVKPQLVITMT